MKKFLVLAAIFSILLFSYGTSQAVMGVADDVPATDLVIPFVCKVGGGLDTLWAIGETSPDVTSKLAINSFFVSIRDKNSSLVIDFFQPITVSDVVSDSCGALTKKMSAANLNQLKTTIVTNGVSTDYYIGYATYVWPVLGADRFVAWVYLTDLAKGFASGFNGYGAEGFGLDGRLNEDALTPVTAWGFNPRYYIHNSGADTWTWWMVLAGRNQYGINASPLPGASFIRELVGYICNEDEDCFSISVPIPDEWNIIDVSHHLPSALHTSYPKAGLAWFFVYEYGFLASPATPEIELIGSIDPVWNVATGGLVGYYSMFGWSYQRAFEPGGSLSWDVVHPMHRTYCDWATSDFNILYDDATFGILDASYISGNSCFSLLMGT